MTVTTHSPETNLFYQFQRVTNSTHPKPELDERMYGVFMMLVCPGGDDDKSSQTNLRYYLPFFIQTGTLYLVISFTMTEALAVPYRKSLNKWDCRKKKCMNQI